MHKQEWQLSPVMGRGFIKILAAGSPEFKALLDKGMQQEAMPLPQASKPVTKGRFLQIAFNDDLASAYRIIPQLPRDDRIWIEAGTPFIKREGFRGIAALRQLWGGRIVADLKTMDGAIEEVELAFQAGASAATVLGSAATETIDLFIQHCEQRGIDSMIDLIGSEDPLPVLRRLRKPPTVMILHRGRDEENSRGKVIGYKQVTRIKSKYDVLISAAGGVDLKEARSAIFNGANIVVVNIVTESDIWRGITDNDSIAEMAEQFLKTIE